mgnify:CR=1 FL=1
MGISSQLFKFRPVDKHAIDSLVTRRLFLAPWKTLNDAHEAQMFIRAPGFNCHMNPERVSMFAPTLLSFNVTGTRVCSLSRGWASNLLWSHYADGHQGLAIGLSLPANLDGIQILPVEYNDKLPELRPSHWKGWCAPSPTVQVQRVAVRRGDAPRYIRSRMRLSFWSRDMRCDIRTAHF